MPPAIGDAAPAFTVALSEGSVARLEDFRGHPLVLIFLRHLA